MSDFEDKELEKGLLKKAPVDFDCGDIVALQVLLVQRNVDNKYLKYERDEYRHELKTIAESTCYHCSDKALEVLKKYEVKE